MACSKGISSLLSLFLVVVEVVRSQSLDTATVSITANVAFAIEPACVQSCMFYNSFGVADYLLAGIGCTSTIYNACYCTQIVDQSVSTILSTCINTLCKGTTEIAPALSLYDSYCAGAGYPRSVAVSTTATSSSPARTSASVSSTATTSGPPSTSESTTASSTSTTAGVQSSSQSSAQPSSTSGASSSTSSLGTPSSSSTSGSKINTGAIAGGVVGGVVGLALIIGGVFFLLRRNQHKPEHHEAMAAAPKPPKEEDHKEAVPVSAEEPPIVVDKPVSKPPAGGRAELDEATGRSANVQHTGVESPPPRYGLRPEELDAEGRYIGELHADGRQYTNELP